MLGLVLAVLLLAMTGPVRAAEGEGTTPATPRVAGPRLDERDAYRLALIRMRGTLGVAQALIRLRDDGAVYYLREALPRLFGEAEPALSRRGAPFTRDLLEEVKSAAALEPARALPAIASAVQAVNGSFAQTGAPDRDSVLALVEALLRESVARYRDAVSENAVVDLRGYQTGRGLVTQAEALVRYSGALPDGPVREELLNVVTLIRQSWPGIMPPPIVFGPRRVAQRLEEAIVLLRRMR